jgi:hypothetical protein
VCGGKYNTLAELCTEASNLMPQKQMEEKIREPDRNDLVALSGPNTTTEPEQGEVYAMNLGYRQWQRQKQRQEYLEKKAELSYDIFYASLRLGLVIFITMVLGYFAWIAPRKSDIEETVWDICGRVIIALSAVGGMTYACPRLFRSVVELKEQREEIPFVPPITTDTLPADEVLVRASEEPTQEQSAILLRAAGVSAEVPADELLRASRVEKG